MKKILLFSSILLMVSCKPETTKDENGTSVVVSSSDDENNDDIEKITDWKVEVKYLDKTVDTIVVRSVDPPFLYIDGHVSIVTLGDNYLPAASYVKTINILNEQ